MTLNPNWKAIFDACQKQAKECPEQCADAPSLGVFMKDIVNVKIGKPIHDQKNFAKWKAIINLTSEVKQVNVTKTQHRA